MKRAFSLLELLVVIGIIGILIASLMSVFGGTTDRARAVKCATNLKNLAAAVSSYAISGSYPYAQSAQYIDVSKDVNDSGIVYGVHRGWISYLDQDTKYPLKSPGSFAQPSFAGNDDEKWHALTNGAIWKAIGGNHDCYLCPVFKSACERAGVKNPGWSYQMNAYFGYEEKKGEAFADPDSVIRANELTRADRILLFAEIPAQELTSKIEGKTGVKSLPKVVLNGSNGDTATDGCLWYKEKGGNESIGFNHLSGHRLVGHVAFADGHVEAIAAPTKGNFEDLTDWLCRGRDVVYHDGSYEEVNNSNESEE